MPDIVRTFSAEELATEAGLSVDRIEWLVRLGVLRPREPGPFRFGDVFRVKLVAALLEGGSAQSRWSGRSRQAISRSIESMSTRSWSPVPDPLDLSPNSCTRWDRGHSSCRPSTRPLGCPPPIPRHDFPSTRRIDSVGSWRGGSSPERRGADQGGASDCRGNADGDVRLGRAHG